MSHEGNRSPRDGLFVNAQTRFRIVLWSLGLILALLTVVNRRFRIWPIVSWPMYSKKSHHYPEAKAHQFEIRVTNGGRVVRVVLPHDLLPLGASAQVGEMLEAAFSDTNAAVRDECRRYLAEKFGLEPGAGREATVEGWIVEWDVDPLLLPPLDRSRPSGAVQLGSFRAADYISASARK